MALNAQRMNFADLVFTGLAHELAAKEAKYSAKSAARQATRLMKDPEVLAYLAGLRKVQSEQVQIDGKYWLEQEALRAYSDISDLIDIDLEGNIKLKAKLSALPKAITRQISRIGKNSDGVLEIRMHPNQVARTNIGKHFNMFKENNEAMGEQLAELIDKVSREKKQEIAEVAKILLLGTGGRG